MPKRSGFTLIELLIVIAIITVLAVIGIVVYSGAQTKARDVRRKADLQQMATAYEVNYDRGQYMALVGTQFSSGQIPKDPKDNVSYTCIKGPDDNCPIPHDQTAFQICATLEDGSTFCRQAAQGGEGIAMVLPPSSPTPVPTPVPSPTPPPSSFCPSSGLVAYWKMDEASGTVVSDSQGINHGTATNGATAGAAGKIGNARSFDGGSGIISYGTVMASTLPVTLSLWVKPVQVVSVGIFDSAPSRQNSFRNFPYGNVEWWPASPNVLLGLSSDLWAHLVFVARYDSGSGTRYVDYYKNGALITTASSIGSSALPWTNFNLGAINWGTEAWYWGLIDEVGIWSRALSPAEVATLYNSGTGLTCP